MRKLGTLCYALAAVALVATLTGLLFGPEWIEELTGLRPDGGDGSLEALLVVVPAVGAVLLGATGYRLRRVARV